MQLAVAVLAARRPDALYGAIDRGAHATAPLARRRERERVERLRALFPQLDPAAAERAAREMRCSATKSRALGIALAHGRGELVFPAISVPPALAAVRGPAVLATFHLGAVGALGEVARRLPGEVAALHRMEWRLPRNVVSIYVEETDIGRARVFHRALATLRRAGIVMLPAEGGGHPVSLLGRVAALKRGPFALARLTGAPVIPLIARWTGACVDVVCGASIAASDDEAAMAHGVALMLQRHLLAHPADIGDELLAYLSGARPSQPWPAAP